MRACNFDAFALAERRAVPVEVVDLELHDFGLRVVSDELLELFGRAVRREADMLCQAAFLHALHEVPGVVFLELGRADAAKVVHEIEVEILDAQVLKRLLQLLLKILGAVATRPSNALVGDIERIARITLDERLAQRCLAVGISPCRVEVVSTSLHVGVDHLRGVLYVDRVVLAPCKAHAAKPKLADVAGIKRHVSPLSIALLLA